MRRRKPHPLAAHIVHVREDRRNAARVAGRVGCRWFSGPGGRVQMFDKHLVHAIVGGKCLGRGSAELSLLHLGFVKCGFVKFGFVKFGRTRHGSRFLDLSYGFEGPRAFARGCSGSPASLKKCFKKRML